MRHIAQKNRYEQMVYNRLGTSGLLLPAISLGLWHNFGEVDVYDNAKSLLLEAFDRGVTHFDLANNYGPPPGSAEETLGKIIGNELSAYRDELIISSKAGYEMWPGPYGDHGSRKYIIASANQSLKRMKLEYVDIFYSHRFDPDTPLEETMLALDQLVKQGKALYVGISNYTAEKTFEAASILKELKTPFVIHQMRYNLFDRAPETGLLKTLTEIGVGGIAFSPLEQGLLTDRYLDGIPENSRAAKTTSPFLNKQDITDEKITCIKKLNDIAKKRHQSMAQMAIAWLLNRESIASVLVGASSTEQLIKNIDSIRNLNFSESELETIEAFTKQLVYTERKKRN